MSLRELFTPTSVYTPMMNPGFNTLLVNGTATFDGTVIIAGGGSIESTDINVDNISEYTPANGVNVLNQLNVDSIKGYTNPSDISIGDLNINSSGINLPTGDSYNINNAPILANNNLRIYNGANFNNINSSTTNNTTFSLPNKVSNDTFAMISDVPSPVDFVTINTNQSITGIKTFSTAPIISTISNTGTVTVPTTTGTLALTSQLPNQAVNTTSSPQFVDLNLTGDLKLPATTSSTGRVLINSNPFVSGFGPNNSFIGEAAGNFTCSGASNSVLGAGAMAGLTSGNNNVAIGVTASQSNSSGTDNTAVGFGALKATTSGSSNTGIGKNSGTFMTTGTGNVLIGTSSGVAYTGAETNNIIIGSNVSGSNGESQVIRIGDAQTACYVAGINGQNTLATANLVGIDSNAKIGTSMSTLSTSADIEGNSYKIAGNNALSSTALRLNNGANFSNIAATASGNNVTYSLPNKTSSDTIAMLTDLTKYIYYNTAASAANGQFISQYGQSGAENANQYMFRKAGTITEMSVFLPNAAPGVGNSRTFTLRINGVATLNVLTIVDANNSGTITFSQAYSVGDRISIQMAASGATASQAILTITYI